MEELVELIKVKELIRLLEVEELVELIKLIGRTHLLLLPKLE